MLMNPEQLFNQNFMHLYYLPIIEIKNIKMFKLTLIKCQSKNDNSIPLSPEKSINFTQR